MRITNVDGSSYWLNRSIQSQNIMEDQLFKSLKVVKSEIHNSPAHVL